MQTATAVDTKRHDVLYTCNCGLNANVILLALSRGNVLAVLHLNGDMFEKWKVMRPFSVNVLKDVNVPVWIRKIQPNVFVVIL
jgi:hypothetical protein